MAYSLRKWRRIRKIEQLRVYALCYSVLALLDEIAEDVSKHLGQIMTRTWYPSEKYCQNE